MSHHWLVASSSGMPLTAFLDCSRCHRQHNDQAFLALESFQGLKRIQPQRVSGGAWRMPTTFPVSSFGQRDYFLAGFFYTAYSDGKSG